MPRGDRTGRILPFAAGGGDLRYGSLDGQKLGCSVPSYVAARSVADRQKDNFRMALYGNGYGRSARQML